MINKKSIVIAIEAIQDNRKRNIEYLMAYAGASKEKAEHAVLFLDEAIQEFQNELDEINKQETINSYCAYLDI